MQDCVYYYYAIYVHVSVQNTDAALKLDQTIYTRVNLVKLASNILGTLF